MLLSYGMKNYFGFKEGADISFRLNSKVPDSIKQGRAVTTVLGVKGGNGSGKTNLIKALDFLSEFSRSSFLLTEKDYIKADGYFGSKKTCEFYIDFTVRETQYRYELGVVRDHIVYERIFRKALDGTNRKTTKIFERKLDEIVYRSVELSYLDVVILKSKGSIISTAYHYKTNNDTVVMDDIYGFFSSILTNVCYTGLRDLAWSAESLNTATKFYSDNPESFNFVRKIIKECDLGITDIEIRTRKGEGDDDIYFPIFFHDQENKNYWLTGHDESSGTKSLYIKLALYWVVLTNGGVLVMDEFDINYHAFILPKLISLFENKDINKKTAQFIFTSHNTEIIDTLGKYRTYLVNKENNESYCYRLDEIQGDILRNDRLISPIYKEGKIGGVPKL